MYCKITSPENLNQPILQKRVETDDGIRTIAGLGTWEGFINSAEMDSAAKNFGYKFEIIKGYKFETAFIFKDFIETMYNLRQNYPKSDPMNLIAKLLMNSLYGKFAQKNHKTIIQTFQLDPNLNDAEVVEYLDKNCTGIKDFERINDYVIVSREDMSHLEKPKYTVPR